MEIDEVRKLLIEELADDLIQSKSFKILQKTVLGIASSSDLNSFDDQEKLIDYILENIVGKFYSLDSLIRMIKEKILKLSS